MKKWRTVTAALLCLVLPLFCGCGKETSWKYDPGVPAKTSGLTATAGNGQVSVSWTPAADFSPEVSVRYNVYYSTSPTLAGAGKLIAAGNSAIVTGLSNDVTYYFAVAALTASGEGQRSDIASATTSPSGAFSQADLAGTWSFHALSTGGNGSWMRGTAVIDPAGHVSVSAFVDSAGTSAIPADFLSGALTMFPEGTVLEAGRGNFHGVLSKNQYKDLLVATDTTAAGSPIMTILQKRVPGISYAPADIQGTGQAGAGPLTYVYHQLSGGPGGEWEYALSQVGRDQTETYSSIAGSTARALPGAGNKVVSLVITTDGIVSEAAIAGVLPAPTVLLNQAVMSADKMTIVGTATDTSGKPVLRIMQLIHPPSVSLTSSSYSIWDLAGDYGVHLLGTGGSSGWGYGTAAITASGAVSYSSFLDGNGNTSLPSALSLAMDQEGTLTAAGDLTYNGKLSYFKDFIVATGTAGSGAPYLTMALKK